jgi:hypothetical protein
MLCSIKVVKPLHELIHPFTIKPERDIRGAVNGKFFYFPKGVETEMEFPAYQAVFNSDYKGEL